MLFRLGLCRNGIGVVVQVEDAFRRVRAELLFNECGLRLSEDLPGCGKQVDILCQQRVDSDRRERVVCTSFEDRQVCVIATRSRDAICSELKAPAQAVADRFFDN